MSKVQAIGCMMVSIMFNDYKTIKSFYLETEEYSRFSDKSISSEIKKVEHIPTYKIQKSEERYIQVLEIVVESDGRISKK